MEDFGQVTSTSQKRIKRSIQQKENQSENIVRDRIHLQGRGNCEQYRYKVIDTEPRIEIADSSEAVYDRTNHVKILDSKQVRVKIPGIMRRAPGLKTNLGLASRTPSFSEIFVRKFPKQEPTISKASWMPPLHQERSKVSVESKIISTLTRRPSCRHFH